MRHFHEVVIDNVGKVICGKIVGTLIEHFVVENIAFYSDGAAEKIVYFDIATGLDFEAYHILCA